MAGNAAVVMKSAGNMMNNGRLIMRRRVCPEKTRVLYDSGERCGG